MFPAANQFTVWNTDSNGNFVSDTLGVVAGNSLTLEQLETSFHQDLNSDGTIGPPTTMIESYGSTSLVEITGNYYFYPVGGTSGPELQYNDAPFVAGQAGTWTPIGAEQTASGGYEVAWTFAGGNQFTVWNTDSNGNFVSDTLGVVAGNSLTLEQLELSFHQDLNGDGSIGPPIIEADGSTSLVEAGSNYYFYPIGGSSGPELKYAGAPFAAGEAGTWTPIGAEQTGSGGYEVAWTVPGSNQFTFWNTDSNGNYVSDTLGVVSGTSATLTSLELTFFQDLNGDGYIDTPTTTISVNGHVVLSNTLAQPAAIAAGATLELTAGASPLGLITFNGSTGTLILDHSSTFGAHITGFTGTGALASSDVLDLKDIVFPSGAHETYSGNSSGGTLTIIDGDHDTASISLTGNYLSATFTLSNDGSGGTDVIDPPATQSSAGAQASNANGTSTDSLSTQGKLGNDDFIFKADFGAGIAANATSSGSNAAHDLSATNHNDQLQTAGNHPEIGPQAPFQMANAAHDAAFNHDHQGPVISPIPEVHQIELHPLLIG